ncbi:oxygenase MpaB family protein [Edaphobacter bradus]|uniref:oxygenase MpaB family protein n=1 Tax=Edaphobacter bradus TaxID=2259016 RepID=UPI0021DFFB35|nr:oxygenase MpaB family protein [Edaphobacter bradus]
MSDKSSLVSNVSNNDIEALWNSVEEETADPREGIFGWSSVSWKVNREAALFLGAGRAALLQLAHPWVAAALDQHSNLRNDPVARFHNTFRVVFTMIFGTLSQALAASRHLYSLHTRITGELPEGVAGYRRGGHYAANEVNALLWVYSTLVESALMAYDCVLPPLSQEERKSYYAESRMMAALFGIPAEALPADLGAFEEYNRGMWDSDRLGVSTLSREMAQGVLHGRGSLVTIPEWYRALTAAWMPERLRVEFGLGFGRQEQQAALKALRWLPIIYRRLPGAVRFVGPYQEALARLEGKHVRSLVVTSNRFWMGQGRMMFSVGGKQDPDDEDPG